MTSLHVICGLEFFIKNFGYAYVMHCSTLITINKRLLLIKQELICVSWLSNKIWEGFILLVSFMPIYPVIFCEF